MCGCAAAGLLAAAAMCFAAGCATTPASAPPGPPVNLTLGSQGVVTFAGRPVPTEQLGRELLRSGVSVRQEIRVHLPEGPRDDARTAALSAALRKSGFIRVFFVGERHAVSSVGADPDAPAR
jgi:hypothetical protein